MYSCD